MSPADSERDIPRPRIDRARACSTAPDDLSVRIDGGAVFVTGVLDGSTSHLLLAAVEYLQAAGRVEIQLHLADVRRIESAGIRALFDRQNALADAGAQLRIIAPPALLPRLALCRVETRNGPTEPSPVPAVSVGDPCPADVRPNQHAYGSTRPQDRGR